MNVCKIELDGKEVMIPKADLKWFLKNTDAKEIKQKNKKENK